MPVPSTYRDQIAPTQLNTFPVDDGGAARAEALADTFRSSGNTAFQVGTKIRTQEGQDAGQVAGASGKPDFKTGFKSLTAFGTAYNDAATRSYAIKADGDAAVTAARLEAESNNDPELFKTTLTAARDATLAAAPPEARGILADIYNQRLSAGYVRVQGAQMAEIHKQAVATLSDGVDQQIATTAEKLASRDPIVREQGVIEHEKGTMMIDAARLDGTISDAQADALHQSMTFEVIKGTHLAEFKQVLDDPHGDPAAYIQNLDDRNKTDNALPPDEEEKLHASLMATMRDHNALIAEGQRGDAAAQKARWDAGEKDVTEKLLQYRLTDSYLLHKLQSGDLDPQIARTLRSTLHSPEAEKSNPAKLQYYSLNLLGVSETDILADPGLTRADQTTLIQKRRTETAPDAWQSTQEAHTARDRIDRALKIIPGSIDAKMMIADPAKYNEWASAHTAFENAVEGTDPAKRQGHMVEIADGVIKTNITKATVASRDKLQAAIEKLKAHANDPDVQTRAGRKEYNEKMSKLQVQLDSAQKGQQ